MAAPGEKRKSVFLSIADKLRVIERLEAGCSVRNAAEEFGLGLTTVKDLKKNKDKLRSFSRRFDAGSNAIKVRKTMRRLPSEAIDEAVYKWYSQHRASGVTVRGTEILAAAERFAKQLNIQKASFSSAWLWRFMNRHGLPGVRRSVGEQNGQDLIEKDLFLDELKDIIEQSKLSLGQLYNFDETGLLYCMLPEDLLSTKPDQFMEEQKLSEERVSALVCANASGSHRLKPAVVGKHKWPCVAKKDHQQLPVHYYHGSNAWFTWDIVKDWFYKYAEPEIRRFQIEDLKMVPSDVCALILMDRAPVHLDGHTLSSRDGRIKCLLIPPNVSLAQPMEQGIILSLKRLYRKKFLHEILIFPEETADGDPDIQEIEPSTNIKNYSLTAAMFNFADAWQDVPLATLANSWKGLLSNSDVQWEMDGIEVADFLKTLTAAGRTEVSETCVFSWLEEDEVDPGYQVLTEEEIVKDVLQSRDKARSEDNSDEAVPRRKRMKLSTIRNHCDDILSYLDTSEDSALLDYYEQFRNFKQIVMRRQQRNASRMSVHDFFQPPGATRPPSTSGPSVE